MSIDVQKTITYTFLSSNRTDSGFLLEEPRFGIYIEKQDGICSSSIFLEKEELEQGLQHLNDRLSPNWRPDYYTDVCSKIDIPKGWGYIE